MNPLGDNFRERSKVQLNAADVLAADAAFNTSPRFQADYIVGKVTGNMLHVLADLVEYDQGAVVVDDAQSHRSAIMEKMNATRTEAARAFATGDWEAFDRLTNPIADGDSRGGTPAG